MSHFKTNMVVTLEMPVKGLTKYLNSGEHDNKWSQLFVLLPAAQALECTSDYIFCACRLDIQTHSGGVQGFGVLPILLPVLGTPCVEKWVWYNHTLCSKPALTATDSWATVSVTFIYAWTTVSGTWLCKQLETPLSNMGAFLHKGTVRLCGEDREWKRIGCWG